MTPFDREIWARTVWMEARGDGDVGMLAVAHVINNRFKSGRWSCGGKITHALICLNDLQFSCWNADRNDQNREKMAVCDEYDDALIYCRSVVRMIEDGDHDPTGNATHYYSVSMPLAPVWAASGTFTVKIGKHRFYADVK